VTPDWPCWSYGIVSTDVHPWGSSRTIVTLAIGLFLLAVFFVTEARFARTVDPPVHLQAPEQSRWPTPLP